MNEFPETKYSVWNISYARKTVWFTLLQFSKSIDIFMISLEIDEEAMLECKIRKLMVNFKKVTFQNFNKFFAFPPLTCAIKELEEALEKI